MPGARNGDYVMSMIGVAMPDTVAPGDTVHATFGIGPEYDPCSFLGPMWVRYGPDAIYILAWGVRHPGSACLEPTVSFKPMPKWIDADSTSTRPMFSMRAVFCQPDGSFTERTVVVRIHSPELPPSTNSDSVRTKDAANCRSLIPRPSTP
jgi:hypothetical protein